MCGSTELSVHSNIQRLTAFQALLSASTSAEFLKKKKKKTSILDTTAFGAFFRTTTQLLLQGIRGWIFAGNGLRPGKRHQHHAALARTASSSPLRSIILDRAIVLP